MYTDRNDRFNELSMLATSAIGEEVAAKGVNSRNLQKKCAGGCWVSLREDGVSYTKDTPFGIYDFTDSQQLALADLPTLVISGMIGPELVAISFNPKNYLGFNDAPEKVIDTLCARLECGQGKNCFLKRKEY